MAATARAVDLTGVKEGGVFRPKRKPEGDYRAKIVKADDHQPKDKTSPLGWVLTIQVEGDARSTYAYYLSPADNQLWKISGICRAAGLNVKLSRIKFDPNKLVGKSLGILLEDDEFEGKIKSTIGDVFPVSEVGANADEDAPEGDEIEDDEEIIDDEVDEEPEPVKPPARRRKPAPEPEPEEEEYEDEPEPEPAPVRRRKPAPAPEPDEEEDEEPAPTPVRRRRAAAPVPAKKAARPVARARTAEPEDDDDLDELDVDDLD